MSRRTDLDAPHELTHDEWAAQEPCPKCGGRPGYDPLSGVELKDGHTYNCLTRATRA